MKYYKTTLLLFIFLNVIPYGCKEEFDLNDPDVDLFVDLVIRGEYKSRYLPSFTPGDISELLRFSDNFIEIKTFPVSPISSYWPPKFRLGECLLWTIESIRLSYDISNKIKKFPSLVPTLVRTDISSNDPVERMLDNAKLFDVYNLYKKWWEDNKHRNFEEFRDINPLRESNYEWYLNYKWY
jgi:hypothetical protein